jgi:exopolysaccharide production protein ExoQ
VPTLLYAIGIAALFWLDRDRSARTSKALWLSIIWVAQAGSRPLSEWLNFDVAAEEVPGQLPTGSLFDQLLGTALIVGGAIVLYRRRELVKGLLKSSWPIVLYFSFALISLLWSDFASWGFKRWVKALGDVIMVLIVVSDPEPIIAVKRFFSRIGFVLLPVSVLLINEYPDIGQSFGLNTGVATNKNTLGDVIFLVMLASLWQILTLIRNTNESNRAGRLLAQCVLFGVGIKLLYLAQCATAVACAVLGSALMIATSVPILRRRPAAVHALVVCLLMFGVLFKFAGGSSAVTGALGRGSDLTGRTRIWDILIPMVPSKIGGAGFETFWVGQRVALIFKLVGGPHMTMESHNGYIEVYLNLGWIGVGILVMILLLGYAKAVKVFRRDSALGALLLAYVATAVAYNYSEAGFRILSIEWFCLLLSVIMASRVLTMAEEGTVSTRDESFDTPLPVWWGAEESPDRLAEHSPVTPRLRAT